MGGVELLGQVIWNWTAQRWQGPGGVFVSEKGIAAELDKHLDGMMVTLQGLTDDLYNGIISLAEWEALVAQELKNAWLADAMFAVGGKGNMTAIEFGRIGGGLADEFKHLADFAKQIANGEVSLAQALARTDQYGQAVQQAYWDEWARATDRPEWKDLPALRQVPGDGGTQCHGNCRCTLDETDEGIIWHVYPGESCDDCIALGSGGPYRYEG